MARLYALLLVLLSCHDAALFSGSEAEKKKAVFSYSPVVFEKGSWEYFLQHLPVIDAPILDYRGKPVSYQQKHVGVLPFDVGNRDLQQCADALMRLRAEYLFEQQRHSEIGFHFTGGQFYSWEDYCNGKRVMPKGNDIGFFTTVPCQKTHEALRHYLDIVYNYASTISLAKELKEEEKFKVGTIVIHPGSPGHCFIIIDEATDAEGNKVYKLAEGYTPAQSIYVLRNLEANGIDPWYHLSKGVIETASYTFADYQLKKFQ
jgi:hypothetical protein